MEARAINPWRWQDELGFSQAVEVRGGQRVLFCAGQTSVDENGAPLHPGDMAGQVNKAVENLAAVLAQAGMDLSNVVRLNFYTTDVDAFVTASAALQRDPGPGPLPAGTLLGVDRLAFPELMIELEATAVA